MIKKIDIIGIWNATIHTPFGESKATVSFVSADEPISGTVLGENGSFNFDDGVLLENKLTFSTTINTPIKATLKINATIEDDSFLGTITIDEYARVVIEGNKNVNL